MKPFFFNKPYDRGLVGEWQDLPVLKGAPKPPAIMPSIANIPYAEEMVIRTTRGIICDWWFTKFFHGMASEMPASGSKVTTLVDMFSFEPPTKRRRK